MAWLFFGILTRFLWAACNLVDQYVARFFQGTKGGIGAAAMLQNLFILPFIIILILCKGWPAWTDARVFFWLALGAVTNVMGLVPYLRAIQIDDAHNAVPIFETSPIFVILLSWILFGEAMHVHQLFGALLIILSGVLFMWDRETKKIKTPTLLLMLSSAFLYSLYQLCIRPASLALDEWSVTIYFFSGVFIMGVLIALARPGWFRLMKDVMRETKGRVVQAQLISNVFWFTSLLTLTVAMARAPGAGYVAALSGVQPVFVLLLSWLAGTLGLAQFRKLEWTRDLKLKFLLLPVLFLGIYFLRF